MSKYCPMCDAVTNCTENCTECLKEAEREENKMNELINRIHTEQKQYLADIAQLPPIEIIRKAYEICWREEFIIVLESTEFDDKTMAILLNTPHLLDLLYDEWLSTDVGVGDMLADVIREFVKEEHNND